MVEQRKDYPDILERLTYIEKKVNGGLKEQFEDLKRNQKELFDKHDKKLDDLSALISSRPCVAHDKDISSLMKDKEFKEKVIVSLLVFIILSLIGYGALKNQVDINTHRWDNLIEGRSVK